MRRAACMVRAMKACCPVPRALPGLPVLRLAALELQLELPAVLGARDAGRLVAAGLTRQYAAALLRAFPDAQAADHLGAGADMLLVLPPCWCCPAGAGGQGRRMRTMPGQPCQGQATGCPADPLLRLGSADLSELVPCTPCQMQRMRTIV